MARLHVNPRYRAWLHKHGLVSGEDFLRLSGVILCGHPARHVARVSLGNGDHAVTGYLKKEHRVRWRDRLANAWAGFGLVSKSWREMVVLHQAAQAGIGCPEIIAAGEVGRQAFLLVAEVPGATDLRTYLKQISSRPDRSALAEQLGAALARICQAGFHDADLYAKHVLVVRKRNTEGVSFCFIDWQRARWSGRRSRSRPWQALARLDATLPNELVSPEERLLCLRAYLRSLRREDQLKNVAQAIGMDSQRLQQRRQIREMRQACVPAGSQDLLWLDGEALCVTREFHEEVQGRMPNWLALPRLSPRAGNRVERTVIRNRAATVRERGGVSLPLPDGRGSDVALAVQPAMNTAPPLHLVRRWASRPWSWLAAVLRGRSLRSPELDQAATIFRLQRFGVNVPRLLAFGQRFHAPWRAASFLLTELPPSTLPLKQWLSENQHTARSGVGRRRQEVFRQAGKMCRLIHQAGYFFDVAPDGVADLLLVQDQPRPSIGLGAVDGLRRRFPVSPGRIQADLVNLNRALAPLCTRTDQLRFLSSYLETPRLTDNARRWIRRFLLPRIDQAYRVGDTNAPGPVMKGALSA